MTRTKRQQNNVILHFSFYLVGVVLLIVFNFNYIFPNYKEIEELKKSTHDVYQNKIRVDTNGINLTEFRENFTGELPSGRSFLTNIIDSLNEDFYNEVFLNNSGTSYQDYLDELLVKYSDKSEYDKNFSLISSILPVYSEISNFGDDAPEALKEYINNNDLLSDFRFVNYIESLADTFNVNFNNSIGVEKIVLLDEYSIGTGDNSLETNIYYIPLTLDITGNKDSVIDLLYFIENVGNLNLKGGELSLNSGFPSDFSNLKNTVIRGANKTSNYNIFNNNIMDVHSISFSDYIDSSFDFDQNQSFVGFLKSKQGKESINVRAEIRFYVKGFPSYIIEGYINNFISKFNTVQSELNKKLGSEGINQLKIERLTALNSTLTQLRVTLIANIQKSLATKINIEEAYNEAYKYNEILDDFLNQINN